jgi:manganese transport protein
MSWKTVGAMIYGDNIVTPQKPRSMKIRGQYKDMLSEKGFTVEIQLGFGKPNKVIRRSSIKEISFWS